MKRRTVKIDRKLPERRKRKAIAGVVAERRHTKDCKESRLAKGLSVLKPDEVKACECPCRYMGVDVHGRMHNESAHTSDYNQAALWAIDVNAGKPIERPMEDMELCIALDAYIKVLRNKMEPRSIKHCVVEDFLALAAEKNIKWMSQLEPPKGGFFVQALIATWPERPRPKPGQPDVRTLGTFTSGTRAHYINFVKKFFAMAVQEGWGIKKDPAKHVASVQQDVQKKTKPFQLDSDCFGKPGVVSEDQRIIDAIPSWLSPFKFHRKKSPSAWTTRPTTGAALLFILRFTGLRISDAIYFEPRSLTLQKHHLRNGRQVMIYTYNLPYQQKTGTPVAVHIPDHIAQYIISAPRLTEKWAFYDPEGTDTPEGLVEYAKRRRVGINARWTTRNAKALPYSAEQHQKNWIARIWATLCKNLERSSGVKHIHPHRFRDTFACDLLRNGVKMETVAELLGDKLDTVERHYKHWSPAAQMETVEQLTAAWESKFNDASELYGPKIVPIKRRSKNPVQEISSKRIVTKRQ